MTGSNKTTRVPWSLTIGGYVFQQLTGAAGADHVTIRRAAA
jgi:hypothetical protein